MLLSKIALTDIFRTLKHITLVIIGTVMIAFGTGVFILPFDLVVGGVSGMGIILSHLLQDISPFSIISPDTYASFLNLLFFFIGFILLGRRFAEKTLVSTLVYPPALSLSISLSGGNMLDGFFNLLSDKYISFGSLNILLSSLFGGVLIGLGCALTFIGGGSSGGADIIALAFCRYFRRMKSAHLLFLIDATVILIGAIVVNNFILSLLGMVSAFVCAITVDKILSITESD